MNFICMDKYWRKYVNSNVHGQRQTLLEIMTAVLIDEGLLLGNELSQFCVVPRASQVAQWQRILLQCQRCRFDPWVRNIPCRRKWQLTPLFLLEKSHGQRSLAYYRPWDCKRVRHNLETKQQLQSLRAEIGSRVRIKGKLISILRRE